MKKILRVFTALFLCFVMLLYTGPMQVAASGLAGTLYQIAGNIGVNAALRAIGVGPGNSPDAFNTLVTNISDALAPASNFITDVLIAGTSGNWFTFLRGTFLQSILDYIYDNRIVFVPDSVHRVSAGSSFSVGGHNFSISTGYCYTFVGRLPGVSGYSIFFCCSSGYPGIMDSSGSVISNQSSGTVSYGGVSLRVFSKSVSSISGPYFPSGSNIVTTYVSSILAGDIQAVNVGLSTSEDLSLDAVAPSLDDDPYIPWVENSIFNDGETFVPVSLPSLDSSVVSSQTQTQAQAGTSTDAVVDEIIAGSDVVPDTGTIADVIAAIKAIPLALADFFADVVAAVQAIPAAIADIFSPAADPEVYQVDLKDFFPFCIPFDLFDIVMAFAAEPEAPVFEWPISVPRWGFEYTLKVDLQEWEDIASLFRTLELTIFCVGLAIVTREKFLRS